MSDVSDVDDVDDEAKPWAEPGLPLEERASLLEARVAKWAPHGPCEPLLEALRAAEQDGYVRGFNAAEDIFAPRKAG